MKVVVATDSFKGTLRADEACEIIADAIRNTLSDVVVVLKPMADGGEGTAKAMIKAADGQWIPQTVIGPLPEMQVEAGFAWFADETALVEMASASGLELLSSGQMNPLKTTTFGTGQLIRAAVEYGAKKVLLAVGGSATVDGGLGAAAALGWKFLDDEGNQVALGGQGLATLARIIRPEPDVLLATRGRIPVEVLCDVDNPLCGEHGAAKVYGPQKGATPKMVEQLETGLKNLAHLVREQLGREIESLPGAGAAGGLGAGAAAFMDASIVSGIETVMARSNLNAELASADWVITGEGSFDRQSLYGKVVSGILKMAGQSNTRVAVLAGQVRLPEELWRKNGIVAVIATKPDDASLDYALKNSRTLLASAAQRLTQEHLSG
ncbi:MAG: glycerate kinase [Phycisphaerales bacterium]|nr:MAG: glycerate kinase [Phycisphaerales bacterium]